MQNCPVDGYVSFTFEILSQCGVEGVKTVNFLILDSKIKFQGTVEIVPNKKGVRSITIIRINTNELVGYAYYDHPMVKYVVKTSVLSDNT